MLTLPISESLSVNSVFENVLQLRLKNLVVTNRNNGTLEYFSTLAITSSSSSLFILEGYISGPSAPDLHYKIEYNLSLQEAVVTLIRHRGNPAIDYRVVRMELAVLLNVAKKRVKQMGRKVGGMNMATGFSLYPGTSGAKSKANFTIAIKQGELTLDFAEFCKKRNFQLRRKL